MKYGIFAATLLIVAAACQVQAEEGVPSQSKLSSLGLGSMQVADDHAGMQVRGEGYAQGGALFIVSNGGGGILPFGFGFFPGFPVGGLGGTTAQLNMQNTSGVLLPGAPSPAPAFVAVGTTPTAINNAGNLVTGTATPITVTNTVTTPAGVFSTSATATGTLYGFGF